MVGEENVKVLAFQISYIFLVCHTRYKNLRIEDGMGIFFFFFNVLSKRAKDIEKPLRGFEN